MGKRTARRAMSTMLVFVSILVLPAVAGISRASALAVFDFEAPSQTATDWAAGACYAPSWLAGEVVATQSDAQASEGAYSLALPVTMAGGGWDQTGIDCILPDPRPWDLTPYIAVTVDIYAPTTGLIADLLFNDPWQQSSTPMRALAQGWNTISYDLTAASADFPGGKPDGKEIVLRVVGQGVTFAGDVYVDNIQLVPNPAPSVKLVAPTQDETVSAPQGGNYTITATVAPGTGGAVSSVTWSTGDRSGVMTLVDPANNTWTSEWDIWAADEGVQKLVLTATDVSGNSISVPVTLLVQNSALQVKTISPTFDSQLSGLVRVQAAVKPDARFGVPAVWLSAGWLAIPGMLGPADADGWRPAKFALPTQVLKDGVVTLKVMARDRHFTVISETDAVIDSGRRPWSLVRAEGTSFTSGQRPFAYVGWNEYELFTRSDKTTEHVQETITGRVIPKGTLIPWQEQIDRQMLEAARHRLTVLRTWAFDDNNEAIAFQPELGVYNEEAFKKLDYVVDSARRHRIRVILTFANYWNDYGGIQSYANQLGLANKLLFFSDPNARTYYEQYVEHLVTRVNTVNQIPYRDDPTIFAWELMNEPRHSCSDDPTGPEFQYCDPSGNTLAGWMAQEAAYVKSLDPNHMVSSGSEAHGLVETPNGPFQWAGDQEGNNNDPWMIQDVPGIDFLTFHPYPNANWALFTYAQAHDLVTGLTRGGVARGKPVVMSEYGVHRSQPITDPAGNEVAPTDPSYENLRAGWYGMMLADCYMNGCAGSNVWMLADWSDSELNVNLYMPQADAERDAPIVRALEAWGRWLESPFWRP